MEKISMHRMNNKVPAKRDASPQGPSLIAPVATAITTGVVSSIAGVVPVRDAPVPKSVEPAIQIGADVLRLSHIGADTLDARLAGTLAGVCLSAAALTLVVIRDIGPDPEKLYEPRKMRLTQGSQNFILACGAFLIVLFNSVVLEPLVFTKWLRTSWFATIDACAELGFAGVGFVLMVWGMQALWPRIPHEMKRKELQATKGP